MINFKISFLFESKSNFCSSNKILEIEKKIENNPGNRIDIYGDLALISIIDWVFSQAEEKNYEEEELTQKNNIKNIADIEKLLDKLGNPQDKIKVIHVAGTNRTDLWIPFLHFRPHLTRTKDCPGQFHP